METKDVISTDQKDYFTNCIVVENNLFDKRPFNAHLPESYLKPIYLIVAKQNGLVYENAIHIIRIENIIYNSINEN